MSTIYNVATATEDTLPSIFAQAADGVPHRIICLLNQLLTAGAGQSAQVYHYYEGEQRKQVQIYYVKPEVELVDINVAGVFCTSGVVTGEDPDAPVEI